MNPESTNYFKLMAFIKYVLNQLAYSRYAIIVILNNHCLGMIRQFQDSYFESNYAATVWGYTAPNFVAVANAYDINAVRIENENQLLSALAQMWEDPTEPYLLEVSVDIHTNVYPKMLFGSPITEMEPSVDIFVS